MDMMDFQNDADLTEKLVKLYGGVAYDYESMPKVVAVHALTCGPDHDAGLCTTEYSHLLHQKGRKLTPFTDASKKCFSILIGIRNKYQAMTRQNSENPHGTSQGNTNELTNKKVQSPRLMEKFKSSGIDDLKSTDIAPCAKDVAGMTGKGRWFLLQQLNNNKSNSGSGSENAGDAFKLGVTETPSLSISSSSLNYTFIHIPGVEKGKKKNLNWSTLGMVAETEGSPSSNHFSPVTKKDSFHLCRENIPTSSVSGTTAKGTSTANPLIQQVKNLANLEALSNDKADPETGPSGFLSETKIPECNVNLNEAAVKYEGEDMETRTVARERSRKRPRKSVPRKAVLKNARVLDDENNNYYSSCSGSADEWSPGSDSDSPLESLDITCYPRSDAVPSTVVNVAEETTGKCTESNQALNSTQQTQRSSSSDYKTQVCLFTDRRIGSLAHYTPSAPRGDEPGLVTSLDREARIKELLSKQEELLTQIRREVR